MKSVLIISLFFYSSLFLYLNAQTVYNSTNSSVHSFLERLTLKKIISFHDEVKPISRKRTADLLLEAKSKVSLMNEIEKKELDWFLEDYALESDLEKEKWFLFRYTDSLFSIRLSPNAGYGISFINGKRGHTKWPGISIYGYYSDYFGAFFEYKDVGEFGELIDREKKFSPLTGAYNKDAPNGIEHSDIRGSISFDWGWGSVSLLKDYMQWGHGRFGQLFISPKAPSYPHIRLNLEPANWISFHYMHGWLNSLVLDSNDFYYTHGDDPFLHKKNQNKFIAANLLRISPLDWLDVSIGNSYVYGGELRPEAFIPFLYYKVMDHNLGREGLDDGNGQIFVDLKADYFNNLEFTGSLLIDVLELRHILQNKWYTSWFGYTLGLKYIDLGVDNLDISMEYTKINPWVYENRDEVTSYKHLGYPLGHWIGQNADQFRIQFDYKYSENLDFTIYNEWIRKGGLMDISYAYKKIIDLPFLYAPLRKDFRMGISFIYEYFHDLYLTGEYQFLNLSDQDNIRTPGIFQGEKHKFSFLLNYGL